MLVELITDNAGFLEIAENWENFVIKSGEKSPYFSSEWISTCFNLFPGFVVAGIIRRNGEILCGIVAQVFNAKGGVFLSPVNVLSFEPRIGTVRPDKLIALKSDKEDDIPVSQLLDKIFLHLRWDVIFFQYYDDRVQWLKNGVEEILNKRKWRSIVGFSAKEAWIMTEKTYEEYFHEIPKKLRRNLSNAKNRLSKEGNPEFKELIQENSSWNEVSEAMLTVYEKSWQSESAESPVHPAWRDKIFPVCKKFFNLGKFSCIVLSVDSVPISFLASFLSDDLVYPVAIGYDKEYEAVSPGALLINECYRIYHSKRAKGAYFGPIKVEARTAYKEKWANKIIDVPNILIVKPFSTYGIVDTLFVKNSLFKKVWWRLFKN
jgi:hypothetical protein